ncbi:hypothetical protein D3C71_1250860 [compost metagenome]
MAHRISQLRRFHPVTVIKNGDVWTAGCIVVDADVERACGEAVVNDVSDRSFYGVPHRSH